MASFKPQRLIKVGGHESDDEEFLRRLGAIIVKLGSGSVIVHGGGAEISELERAVFDREPVFVGGRRLTDSKTLQLVEMVLCGSVNKRIVRALAKHPQIKPLGISGQDSNILCGTCNSELGFVAEDITSNPAPIIDLCAAGFTPVIAPLALDHLGQPLNANADDAASALACSLDVSELILITNVAGVIINGRVKNFLTADEAEDLIRDGSISGGMVVKVRSAAEAAKKSGRVVRICNLDELENGGGTLFGERAHSDDCGRLSPFHCKTEAHPEKLAPLFSKIDLRFKSGDGCWLQDDSGREYLDFGSGIAVNALGHRHPRIVNSLIHRAMLPLHLSNLFPIPEQELLARALTESCFAERVFFSNSGTEANEAALKFAFKYHHSRNDFARKRVVAFKGGFHGRTMGALAVTEKPSYRAPYANHLFNSDFCDFNSVQQINSKLSSDVAAVILEPIQGEAGIHLATSEFMREVRRLCSLHGIILIFDEVQCGLMRTGVMWAHQYYDVEPDIMTTAKPLGGGLPIGATLISEMVSKSLAFGDHGSTFGGNPVACALALEVVDEVHRLKSDIERNSVIISDVMFEISETYPHWISQIRGRGFMWGMDVHCTTSEFIDRARKHGLLLLTAGINTVRILPPLICGEAEITQFKKTLTCVLEELNEKYCDGIQISSAVFSDAINIFELVSSCSDSKSVLPRTLDAIRRDISKFLVARWNNVVVGCVSWRDWGNSHWEVRSLVVASHARGLGIGQRLTECIVSRACKSKVKEVFALSMAPQFFKKLGFSVVPRNRYPFKENADCQNCSWSSDCRETAMGLLLDLEFKSSVGSDVLKADVEK